MNNHSLIRTLTAHFFGLASDQPLSDAVDRTSDRPSALGPEYYYHSDDDTGRANPLSWVVRSIKRQQTLLGAFARQQGLTIDRPEGPGGIEEMSLHGGDIAWAILAALEDGDARRLCVGVVRALAPKHSVAYGVTVSAIDEAAAVQALATLDVAEVVTAIERGDYDTNEQVLAAAVDYRRTEAARMRSAEVKSLRRRIAAERKAMDHYTRHQMPEAAAVQSRIDIMVAQLAALDS